MTARDSWKPVAAVVRDLAADEAVAREVVETVRGSVPAIAALSVDDVVEHTAALVRAGLEAIAARRPPTEAELRYVEELAATRAGQGVSITAMLAGVYAGQRVVWRHAIAGFIARELPVTVVGEVLIAHLGWTHSVHERAIEAHRQAELDAARRERDVRSELLRTLLAGPVETRHARELRRLGLTRLDALWVVVSAVGEHGGLSAAPPGALSARIGGELVALAEERPGVRGELTAPIALVGPVELDGVPAAAALALRTLHAAQRRGAAGLCTPADVAVDIVLGEEAGLGAELGRTWFYGLSPVDRYSRSLVQTLLVHLDTRESLEATARALYVHPNTVRYRLGRLQELTGQALPQDMDGRVRLWWAARAWLQSVPREG